MNYVDLINDRVKAHLYKYHTEICTDKEVVAEALFVRGMEDCDSILVKKHNPQGKITRVMIYVGSEENVLHEIGHILDIFNNNEHYWSATSEFQDIFEMEHEYANYDDYLVQDSNEYFAESFLDYCLDPDMLRCKRPKTFEYVETVISKTDVE